MPARTLLAPGHDEVVAGRAAVHESLADRDLDALYRQRLAVEHEPAVARLGGAEHVRDHVHPRLGRLLRAPDPGDLGLVLGTPALVEQLFVGAQLDSVLAQEVGEIDGKPVWHGRVRDAQIAAGAQQELVADLPRLLPGLEQLVDPVVVRHPRLDAELLYLLDLENVGQDVARPVVLGVQEGVADRDGKLVPKLRRALGVGVNQDLIGHDGHPSRST